MPSQKGQRAESMTVEGAGSRGAEQLKEVRRLSVNSPEGPETCVPLAFQVHLQEVLEFLLIQDLWTVLNSASGNLVLSEYCPLLHTCTYEFPSDDYSVANRIFFSLGVS